MLNIVTGLPGAGKTLYTLSKLVPEYRGRDIYVYGIPAIDHDHFGSQDLQDPEKWYELPEGAVIVIDEAQKIFPLRRPGSMVPQKCSEFETHRHKGYDIVLLTQDATTLDVHIRKLAGKHIHVHRLFGGMTATIYEYANFEAKPTDRNIRKTALSTKTWKYDKNVFGKYKSADLHTVKRKIPTKLIMLPILALAVLAAGVFAFYSVKKLFSKSADEIIYGETGISLESGKTHSDRPIPKKATSIEEYLALTTPVLYGAPWTAPIYNEARKVRTWPKPYCIIHDITKKNPLGWCKCYTQQVTALQNVDPKICRDIANNGFFDHTREDESSGRRARGTREPPPQRSTPVELQDPWGPSTG